MKQIKALGLVGLMAIFFSSVALSDISRVRVVNDSTKTIYVHVGGYAPSSRIEPGQWKIFYYPFTTMPPGAEKKVTTSLLVATSGGNWATNSEGMTYLKDPTMSICLDYASDEHKHKTGNRVWTIKSAFGLDKDCEVKPYKKMSKP